MALLKLEVLTPEKQALSEEVSAVYMEGSQGRFGVLPMHTALIARLDFGQMEYTVGKNTHTLLCGSGLVEVSDETVTVLVKSAEAKDDIDIDRAKHAMARAKSRRDSKDNEIDMTRAEAALHRALHRLKYVGKM